MSFVVTTQGLKGAVPRLLKDALERHLEEVGHTLTPEQRDAIAACQTAANKLIHAAPRGKQVNIQLAFTDTPFGGMDLSVCVTATRPRSR